MADFYETDQTKHHLTRRAPRDAAVHAGAVKVFGATGEPTGWVRFPLCGTPRPDQACTTSRPVTCRRCLAIMAKAPCTATATEGGETLVCERGGPHRTHYARGTAVSWTDSATAPLRPLAAPRRLYPADVARAQADPTVRMWVCTACGATDDPRDTPCLNGRPRGDHAAPARMTLDEYEEYLRAIGPWDREEARRA